MEALTFTAVNIAFCQLTGISNLVRTHILYSVKSMNWGALPYKAMGTLLKGLKQEQVLDCYKRQQGIID